MLTEHFKHHNSCANNVCGVTAMVKKGRATGLSSLALSRTSVILVPQLEMDGSLGSLVCEELAGWSHSENCGQ